MTTQRWLLLFCFVGVLAASIGSRLYVEFAAKTGYQLYFEDYNRNFGYAAPFIAPNFLFRSGSDIVVPVFWGLVLGLGLFAWRRCAPLLTYSLVAAIAVLVLAGEFLWLRFQPDARGRIIPLFERVDMAAHQPFAAGVRSSVALRLFEGLPHQAFERELLKSELKGKQTFRSNGHHFYQTEIIPSEEDALALADIASSPKSFEEWGGMKLCGGYHPDWLIRWTGSDGHSHDLNVCLGCHEAKIHGERYRLYCDLSDTAFARLQAILAKYAKQRPSTSRQ
jgi:hypothetical protein